MKRYPEWDVPEIPAETALRLAKEAGIGLLAAKVLVARGISDPASAASIMKASLKALSGPASLHGMEEATERILQAVRQKEKILIFGDYDVDGVTATAVLSGILRMLGAVPSCYIPHRISEGYGLNPEAVRSIASGGTGLVITVDCGIRSVEEARMLENAGVDLVITDHHEPGDELPPAKALVNPHLGAPETGRAIAGVTVAFYLAWALAEKAAGGRMAERFRKFLLDSIPLVALGTLADVVPLAGDNRILAKAGLRMLERTEHPGLAALLEVSGLRKRRLTARDVAFGLAPRINAAGRMLHASEALRLLTARSFDEAIQTAQLLDNANRERQRTQEQIYRAILSSLEKEREHPAVVAAGDGWHSGIIGIVAGKLAETYNRPAVLVAFDGEEGRGSARSVDGFNLFEALSAVSGRFKTFGGHEQAAGFSMKRDDFEHFREEFLAEVAVRIRQKPSGEVLRTDGFVAPEELSLDNVGEMGALEPFGEGNPEPLLVLHAARMTAPARVIGNGKHLSFHIQTGKKVFRVVAFNFVPALHELENTPELDLAVTPRVDEFNGTRSVSLFLKDFRPSRHHCPPDRPYSG